MDKRSVEQIMSDSRVIKGHNPKARIVTMINKNNPVLLEIGCHEGTDGQEIASYFEQPKLHQFDADTRYHKPGVHPFAIGAVNGEVAFYKSEGRNNASSSLHEPKEHLDLFPDVTFPKRVKVPCMKLDTWYSQNIKGSVVDLIWCDVNGGEQDVLDGGWVTIDCRTRLLYIEFCERELYAGALTMKGILDQLPGYELIGVYKFQGNFGNLLLQNKRFK